MAETLYSAGAPVLGYASKRIPPHVFFIVAAIFHYLGPAFAVLLFASVEPLGVAWLRIASAGVIFAIWRRPWRVLARISASERWTIIGLGVVLAAMNAVFYLAIDRLPLATVGAIEFLGPIALAAFGIRTPRNWVALLLSVVGVYALTDVRFAGDPIGFVLAFANCALFVLYIVLGHRVAAAASAGGASPRAGQRPDPQADSSPINGGASTEVSGIDRLALAMLVATVAALPIGINEALPAFSASVLLAAAIGVGISSSVIPYVCDQLAMARLKRGTFALMLALLPATATLIGFLVLRQVPSARELVGIGLVIAGVAIHRDRTTEAN